MFTYFTEFYKQALYHFLFGGLCAALFALGLEFSKGSEGESNLPYFMPAMVLSGMHVILSIVAILACYYARSLSEIYDGIKRWDHSEEHFRRLKSLYLLLLYPLFLWGIVGASLAGQTGICSTKERPCYYSTNKGQNRAVAIVIVVVHVLNVIVTFFTLPAKHKIRRDVQDESVVLNKRTQFSQKTTQNLNPAIFSVTKQNEVKETDTKIKLSLKKDHTTLKKHTSNVGPKSRENETNKREHLPPIRQPLKRHHTVHTNGGQSRFVEKEDFQSRKMDHRNTDIKPLQPNKNGWGTIITKLRVVAPKHRSASFNQPKGNALYKDSESSMSDSGEYGKELRSSSVRGITRRMTEHPQGPPPSYNQVMAPSNTDPYWLPPPPQNEPVMHRLPERIYSGFSFPDAEPVPVYPAKVPQAKWQIID